MTAAEARGEVIRDLRKHLSRVMEKHARLQAEALKLSLALAEWNGLQENPPRPTVKKKPVPERRIAPVAMDHAIAGALEFMRKHVLDGQLPPEIARKLNHFNRRESAKGRR